MQHALGFSGRAGGVENEEWVFGVERSRFAFARHGVHQVVPPVVAVGHHLDVVAGSPDDDDFFDGWRFFKTLVDGLFQRQFLASSPAGVGGDDEFGLSVVVAVGDGVGTEASEDDRMHRSDAGTGEHRDRQFGDHRHIECHSVAGFDSELLQHVGKPADFAVEVLVAQDSSVARFPFPDDRRLVLSPAVEMSVEAIVGDVDLAAGEPLGVGHVAFRHGFEGFKPIEIFTRQFAPEPIRVVLGPLPHLLVLFEARDMRFGREGLGRRELTIFLQDALNRIATHGTELLVCVVVCVCGGITVCLRLDWTTMAARRLHRWSSCFRSCSWLVVRG